MSLIKALHLIGVAYFLGFLLLDAFVIRRFLNTQCHDKKLLFYEKAKLSLYVFVGLIVISGVWMLLVGDLWSVPLIWVKIAFAFTAIAMFFLSVPIVKRLPKEGVHYYYGVVAVFAAISLILGASVG
jgi:hypothetical protein